MQLLYDYGLFPLFFSDSRGQRRLKMTTWSFSFDMKPLLNEKRRIGSLDEIIIRSLLKALRGGDLQRKNV